jgi:hypothetical protein
MKGMLVLFTVLLLFTNIFIQGKDKFANESSI